MLIQPPLPNPLTTLGFSLLIGFAASAAPGLVDYDGHPFVTNPAPSLSFQRKLAPSPRGIDYDFPEQTAHGVLERVVKAAHRYSAPDF